MPWHWIKRVNLGTVRATFSQRGVGKSLGFFGFRWEVTADGRKYWSFGVRGTGLYYIKYY